MPSWCAFLDDDSGNVAAGFLLEDDDRGHAPDASVTPAQVEALDRVATFEAELFATVFAALRRYYDRVRPKYVEFASRYPDFMGDVGASMSSDPDAATFARLHRFQGIFVHPTVWNGIAYVGFSFSATWEPEHGVGVMVHDRRVVEVGNADTAFTSWIAEGAKHASSSAPGEPPDRDTSTE